MNTKHNPPTIAPPFRNIYSHAVETVEGARHLFVSGQLGVKPDGSIDPDVEGQSEQVMKNLREILASAGMTFADLVKINAYLLTADDIPTFATVRARHLDGAQPAMTTVVVTALAAPQWLVEVDAVAAKRD